MKEAFGLIKQTLDSKIVSGNEAKGILKIITEYATIHGFYFRNIMKKTLLILISYFFLNSEAFANNDCFIVKEKNHILKQEGNCKKRHAPCSTFKIAISLMGYDQGILLDEHDPKWPFKEGYPDYIASWKSDQDPASWIKNSCVWYSQVITTKLGVKKFKDYVAKFNYGNQDVSGDKGKNNGLTESWLSSSLKISPVEQIAFLQKLFDNKLPVSIKSQQLTKNLIFVETLPNGWNLYGKTGSGNLLNKDGSDDRDHQIGWFAGWVEKGNRIITFVNYIEDQHKENSWASKRAKEAAKEKILQVIKD